VAFLAALAALAVVLRWVGAVPTHVICAAAAVALSLSRLAGVGRNFIRARVHELAEIRVVMPPQSSRPLGAVGSTDSFVSVETLHKVTSARAAVGAREYIVRAGR
jgi:hypothetical protein